MYNFLLQISLMASLGVMIYLLARGVSRVADTIDEAISPERPKSVLDRLIARLPLEKLDLIFSEYLEKTLRKIKLFLLKLDNLVSGHLEKIKKTNGNSKNNREKTATLFSENLTTEEENQDKTSPTN